MALWRVSTSGSGDVIGTAAAAFEQRVGPEHLSIAMFKDDDGAWTLDVLYAERIDITAIAMGLCEYDCTLSDLEIYVFPVPEENWVQKSLEGLKPIRAGHFFVHGAHDAGLIPPGLIPICIEAGEAFGTGHHGSTEGCLAALSQIAMDERPTRTLDLGTGSGVLAIAAAKLWRAPVIASDMDPIAVKVAHENARLNGSQAHIRTVTAMGVNHSAIHSLAPFDLVIANILARPLREMAGDISGILAPGGLLVLSGILDEQAARVAATYQGHHVISQVRLAYGEWVTLICRKA